MTASLGINPIGWTNDDIRWLGDDIPLETCLAEASEAGFAGVELGRKFPRRAEILGPILERHGLKLVSGWYSGRLLERDSRREIAAMRDHLALLSALGAPVMVFAETTGETVNHIGAGASARPTISTAADWKRLGKRFTEVADHMLDKGVRMAVHHHMGTVVQTAADVDRLFENCGPSVGLLVDTGHLTYAGDDPVQLIRRHAGRVVHVHCKDIRRGALLACNQRDASFTEAVLHGLFTVPGDGIVDFPAVIKALAAAGYAGWLVQEAEQDPRVAPPAVYARMGNAQLRKLCAAARLKLA
jgi:inosose dehydratase